MMDNRPFLTIACFGLLCTAGAGVASDAGMVRHIVWLPAPHAAAEAAGEPLATPGDLAAASDALAAGEPLPEVLEALDSPEARHLLRRRRAAIPVEEDVDERDAEPEPAPRLVRETDGSGNVRWRFLLGNGKEIVVAPDARVWAFWDNPEGYDQDCYELHLARTGYTAIWVTSRHRQRIPAASTPLAASQSGGASHRAAAPPTASPATVAFSASVPAAAYVLPPATTTLPIPLTAGTFANGAPRNATPTCNVPEPAPFALAVLALASLLARRRRKAEKN